MVLNKKSYVKKLTNWILKTFETDITEKTTHELAFNEFYDISHSSFKNMIDIKVKSISITFDEILAVEEFNQRTILITCMVGKSKRAFN